MSTSILGNYIKNVAVLAFSAIVYVAELVMSGVELEKMADRVAVKKFIEGIIQ